MAATSRPMSRPLTPFRQPVYLAAQSGTHMEVIMPRWLRVRGWWPSYQWSHSSSARGFLAFWPSPRCASSPRLAARVGVFDLSPARRRLGAIREASGVAPPKTKEPL